MDIAGVPAVFDGGLAVGRNGNDAAGIALIAGDLGPVGAAADHGILRRSHHAGVTVDLIIRGTAGEGHEVVAILDGGGAVGGNAAGAAHDAGHIAGDGLGLAVDAEIFDGGAVAQTEQGCVVGADAVKGARVLQIQAGDLMIPAVKGAAVILVAGLVADGRPWAALAADAAEVDIFRQAGVQLRLAAVDLVREPLELGGGGDLIITVLRHGRLVHIRHGDGALCSVAAVLSGDGNGGLALTHAGHNALMDSRDSAVAGLPAELLVRCVLGEDGGGKRRRFAPVDGQCVLIQRHAGDGDLGVSAGLGVLALDEVEAVEVFVVVAAIFRRDIQPFFHQECRGQRNGMAAIFVSRDSVFIIRVCMVVPAHIAVRVKEGAIFRNVGLEICGIGNINRLSPLGNSDSINLLFARVCVM